MRTSRVTSCNRKTRMYIDLRRIDLEYLVNFLDEPLNKCVGTQSRVSHALKKKKKKIFVGL